MNHTHTHTHGYFYKQKVKYVNLIDIAIRNTGTSITAAKMKKIDKKNAPIKIFAGGNTIAFVEWGDVPKEDIITVPSIIVKSRGYIGFEYCEQPFSNKSELWSYTITDKAVNSKYVYYYLLTQRNMLQEVAKSQSVKLPQIYHRNTDNIKIPIINIKEQEEIVNILDRFDKLINDISQGLTAEIEARKKQYKYYRDKLLTFKENKNG